MRALGTVFIPLVGVLLTLIVTIITLATEPHGGGDGSFQLLLIRLPQVFGILIGVVSGLGLLVGALHGDRLESLLPYMLSFMAGLLLISQYWGVALAFGALGVAALLRDVCGRPASPPA